MLGMVSVMEDVLFQVTLLAMRRSWLNSSRARRDWDSITL